MVALAVIGGGAYFLLGGGGGNGDVSADTKGYKLDPGDAVDDYKKAGGDHVERPCPTRRRRRPRRSASRTRQQVGDASTSPGAAEPIRSRARSLSLNGAVGRDRRPREGARRLLRGHHEERRQGREDVKVELVGSPQAVTPAGFEGALMKCQNVKLKHEQGLRPAKGPRRSRSRSASGPTTAPSAVVNAVDAAQIVHQAARHRPGQVAELAAKLTRPRAPRSDPRPNTKGRPASSPAGRPFGVRP